MKLRLLLLSCLLSLTAFGADVVFNLTDFLTTTDALKRKQAMIEPQSTVKGNSAGNLVVTSERRFYNLGTNGSFTATNMVDGVYRVHVYGISYTSVFRINIPATNGSLFASDYLISGSPGIDTEDGQDLDLE